MTVILGFDVSQGVCSVAISRNYEILSSIKLTQNAIQAEQLVPSIEKALKIAQLKYIDIDYLATITGPGSFTGIRIGLACASGLLLSLKAKPVALTNFEIINYRTIEQIKNHDYVIAVINAYRDEIYYQIFNKEQEAVTLPEIINNKRISEVVNPLQGNIFCAGSGLINILPYLDHEKVRYLPRFPIVDARTICKLAFKKIKQNNYSSDLSPLYIRKPDAKLPVKTSYIIS